MNIFSRLQELDKARRNKSPKTLKRLKASMAEQEYQALLKTLPGSARRALERGNQPY